MSGHRQLYVTLLLEPRADSLQGAISTAPAIVIYMVLHVVVIAVDPLDQIHLEKRKKKILLCSSISANEQNTVKDLK